jgi:glutaconate CoA-transferase subunit B
LHAKEELLACIVARLIGEARHVAVGAASPIPAAGALLLKQTRPELRISLLHKRKGNPFTEGSRELFDLAGQGRIDVFFLGGAQIDGEANINLVRVGGHRFPGSFGSAFMYFAVPRVILFREEHSPRVLVKKVDFVSAPGWSPPEVERRGGPVALLTGRALFSWQPERRRFRLDSTHDGEDVRPLTGFDYDVADSVPRTPPPNAAEIRALRGAVAKEMAVNYPDFARRVWRIGASP